ncbi:hypothetical protein KKF82_06345 [Patescibacteria group bacterium]|nr:hypothetical protein [Patescibacteria group bacterium]
MSSNLVLKKNGESIASLGSTDNFRTNYFDDDVSFECDKLEEELSDCREDLARKMSAIAAYDPKNYEDLKDVLEDVYADVEVFADRFLALGRKLVVSYMLEDEEDGLSIEEIF